MTADFDLDLEAAVMLWTAYLEHAIRRKRQLLALRPLLQELFRGLHRRVLDVVEHVAHRLEDDLLRSRETRLEVDGADERLVEARGETHAGSSTGLLFTATETRTLWKTELATDLRERGRRHQCRAQRRQLALRRFRETPVELFADHEIDDRITEELEPLEIADAFSDVLVQIGAVRERGRN